MATDICTVCNKPGWPECGHLDGMPDAPTEGEADAETLAEFEGEDGLTYRRRGRPKLPPDMKRREKLVISVTGNELKDMMHAAADAEGGPLRVQDWGRDVLIKASKKGGE